MPTFSKAPPVTWLPDAKVINYYSVIFKFTPDQITQHARNFAFDAHMGNKKYESFEKGFYQWLENVINPPKISKAQALAAKAHSGFHTAPADFVKEYNERGHAQFDMDRPETWATPKGKVLTVVMSPQKPPKPINAPSSRPIPPFAIDFFNKYGTIDETKKTHSKKLSGAP